MIELPDDPAPNGIEVTPVDAGFLLRPSTMAPLLRVNRQGDRSRVTATYPPMPIDVARKFAVRLRQAKREGLRIDFPLLGVSQGSPGAPVVDGANPAGTTLPIRGLTPGYAIKEGYAMTLIDGDGLRYLHFAAEAAMADASGEVVLTIEPPIRAPLPDGAAILLAKPTVEGALMEDVPMQYAVDRLVRGGSVTIEESAGRAPSIAPTFDSTNPSFTFDSDD